MLDDKNPAEIYSRCRYHHSILILSNVCTFCLFVFHVNICPVSIFADTEDTDWTD